MDPQAKKNQSLPRIRYSLEKSWHKPALLMPLSQTSGLQNTMTINFCVSHQFVEESQKTVMPRLQKTLILDFAFAQIPVRKVLINISVLFSLANQHFPWVFLCTILKIIHNYKKLLQLLFTDIYTCYNKNYRHLKCLLMNYFKTEQETQYLLK